MKDVKRLLTETHVIDQIEDFYDYKGVEITHDSILVSDFNIKDSLCKENLDWAKEQHGRDMLDIIILKIFQLGFQQAKIQDEITQGIRK